jgi:hypothetical protein
MLENGIVTVRRGKKRERDPKEERERDKAPASWHALSGGLGSSAPVHEAAAAQSCCQSGCRRQAQRLEAQRRPGWGVAGAGLSLLWMPSSFQQAQLWQSWLRRRQAAAQRLLLLPRCPCCCCATSS